MDTNQLQLENEKLNARLEKAKEVFKQQAADIKAKDDAYLKLKDEYDELNKQLSEVETQKQSISDMHNKTATALKMRDDEIEELRKNIAKFEESLYLDMKTGEAGKALACQIQETKQLPDENTMNQYITDFKKRLM